MNDFFLPILRLINRAFLKDVLQSFLLRQRKKDITLFMSAMKKDILYLDGHRQ